MRFTGGKSNLLQQVPTSEVTTVCKPRGEADKFLLLMSHPALTFPHQGIARDPIRAGSNSDPEMQRKAMGACLHPCWIRKGLCIITSPFSPHTDTSRWPARPEANQILMVLPLKQTIISWRWTQSSLRRQNITCQNPAALPSCRLELTPSARGAEIPIHKGPLRRWMGDELSNKNIYFKKKCTTSFLKVPFDHCNLWF